MNKQEKEIMETFGEKLINSIDLLTKAIQYHADVIGMEGDKAKLTAEISLPDKSYTLDDIKSTLNKYAKREGKDAALALVKRFAGSHNPADIKEADYPKIIAEAA